MAKYSASLNKSDISKIQVYVNTSKKSLATIKKETGADYIINGTLYRMSTFKPEMNMIVDGKVLAQNTYKYWGYSWDNPNNFGMRVVLDKTYANNICGTELIVLNVGLRNPVNYNADVGGSRPRTAIGTSGNKVVLFACNDTMTPEQLRDYMYSTLKCDSAIMLDSGGSTQCDMMGKTITSSRIVHNHILVYMKKNTTTTPSTNTNTNTNNTTNGGSSTVMGLTITQNIMTNSPNYTNRIARTKTKSMLHSTGTPGAMANAIRNSMNSKNAGAGVEFILDDTVCMQTLPYDIASWHCGTAYSGGPSANNTHVATEICEPLQTRVIPINWKALYRNGPSNTTYAVTLLQKELVARGYDPKGVDGSFGPGCDAALRKFQSDNKLVVDGSCGKASLEVLQKRTGSFLKYNVEEATPYFNKVYNMAVKLFAAQMKRVNGNPKSDIICHSEGYALKIASNHADVMHWFPLHGKSMDVFRTDVAACMAGTYKDLGTEVVVPPTVPEVTKSDLEVAVDKLVAKGVMLDGKYWSSLNATELSKNVTQFVANVETLIKNMASKL